MSTKGTKTNISKLVGWSIDEYNSIDDTECLVCLTAKEKYLLGQMTRQLEWQNRWFNPDEIALPDLSALAAVLDEKLSPQSCLDFCQLILDCIDDTESGVSQAIYNLVYDSNSVNQIATGQNQAGLLLGDGNNPTCDFDVWWGGVNNLVNQLDINNLDALQILEVLTNSAEWLAEVAAGVAGVEIPLVQSMLDWANFIQNSIMENYEAQITTEYMNTLKCDLFCIATENCELTPEQLVDYFMSRLGSQLTFSSLLNESLEFLFTGLWSGTEIADVMMLSQLVFRAQLGRWFDFVAFNSIDLDLRLGFNDPSDDWTLLCDCGYCFLFTPRWTDKQDWVFTFGQDVGDLLWTDLTGSDSQQFFANYYPVANVDNATNIKFGFRAYHIKPVRIAFIEVKLLGVQVGYVEWTTFNADLINTQYLDLDVTGIEFDEIIVYWASYPTPDINGSLDTIEITGIGTNPFGSDNC